MARYLVTGGCGFIGSHLVERLLADGHEVTVLDDLSTGKSDHLAEAAALIFGDVADPQAVADAMAGQDGCFHLAAIASVERSRDDWARTHQVNLGGTINVFDAARRVADEPVPVVFASSAAIYGDNPAVPLAEDAEPRPLTAYCVDKLAGEHYARVADRIHGVPVTGFRFFNVYGPRQHPASPYSGVISLFAARIRRGEPVTVFGDGELVRDFVYVGDVIQYLTAAMAQPMPGAPVFNVCTGTATSLNDLARLVAELLGTDTGLQSAPPPPEGDIRVSVGDPRRLMAEFGFACDTSLRDGLRKTLKGLE
ncbi:MAG: NAD-dependent epimerase/dehydratase family protein [Rhodospirillaceae bacterium]